MTKTLSDAEIYALADLMADARDNARSVPKLTIQHPNMNLDDAYAVQNELRRRLVAAGEKVIGWKAGLTSKNKMVQMGLALPTIGFLTDKMALVEGPKVSLKGLIHPKVESEIAFVTKSELRGPDCTEHDVLAATDFVCAALEVIDSRFVDFKFDGPSVVADNSSSARYIPGARARYPADVDLRTIGVVLERNGEIAAMGAAADVMGHPARAIAMVVNVMASLGLSLPAGSFVMSGAVTAAVSIKPGDVVVSRFLEFGDISVKFVD